MIAYCANCKHVNQIRNVCPTCERRYCVSCCTGAERRSGDDALLCRWCYNELAEVRP